MLTKTDALMGSLYAKITGCPPECHQFANRFLILFLLSYIVYARGIYFPVLGIDTMTYFNGHGKPDVLLEVVSGRWGLTLINSLVGPPLVSPLITHLFLILCVVFGTQLVFTFWNVPGAMLPMSLMCIFPYWAGQAYFSFYHVAYGLCFVLALLSVVLVWRKRSLWRCMTAIACAIFSASIYQASILYSLILICVSFYVFFTLNPARHQLKNAFAVAMIQLSGGIIYLAAHKLVLSIMGFSGVAQGYAVNFSFDIQRPLAALKLIFPGNQLLLPVTCQYMLAGLTIIAIWTIVRRMRGRIREMVLAVLALICSFAAPLALSMAQGVDVPSRAMCGLSIAWAGVSLLAVFFSGKRLRNFVGAALIVLLVIFAARINYAWQIQELTTVADLDEAREIWREINNLPEFSLAPKPLEIAFTGCHGTDTRNWPQDRDSIFGLSQFSCLGGNASWPPHPLAALRFAGANVKLVPATDGDWENSLGRRPWPANESVFWERGHVVVWLGPPQRAQNCIGAKVAVLAQCLGIPGYDTPSINVSGKLLKLVENSAGPWVAHRLKSCLGNVDFVEPLPEDTRFKLATGWVYDPGPKVVPSYVAIMNCQNQIVGVGATGTKREDVAEKIAIDAEYSGFEGFVLAGEKICGLKY